MATLREVAALAGVSTSMVSRVLNDAPDTRATDETRQRIRDAATELGYRANFAARALKNSRTHVIGVVLPDLANPIYVDLLDAIEEEAARQGYLTLLARAEGLLTNPEAIPRLVHEGRVDGVIIQASDGLGADALTGLTGGSTPAVFVNSSHPRESGSVLLDDAAGGRLAAEHLWRLGHRDIAFAGGLPGSENSARRQEGFAAALQELGGSLPEHRISRRGFAVDHGTAAVDDLLRAGTRPTAIAVANVNAAFGVLTELRRRGVSVPDEMSVIAIHEAPGAQHTWPPLTTIEMPLAALGVAAVSALRELIDAGAVSDTVVSVPLPRLRERESTCPPPSDERRRAIV
jgi:DNA-binding LacI/PurR family transcriptional regulator